MLKVVNFFTEALKQNHLSHSYLLSGTEDLRLAKEIAKHILCKQEHTACGSCSSCLKLDSDNHPDLLVIEPEGASIKNAQVEQFQEYVFIRPFESQYKIIIFNQMHLMTERAQNRMLKVLEEPPEYAVFFFLTEQADTLLETVVSRCQILNVNSGEKETDNIQLREKALDWVVGIEKNDTARVLEIGAYAKQDKIRFIELLSYVSGLLRDIMIFRETKNYQLISHENLTILNYREYLPRFVTGISRKKNIQIIICIEDVEQKIKNNMNFDLTVDKLLFKCID